MISITVAPKITTPPESFFYRVKTDLEVGRLDRATMPMVWVLADFSMLLTREWQWYLVAINYTMQRRHVAALLDYQKAFTNRNGFGNPSDPRQNWIMFENLDAKELPKFDKVRTCSNALVRMEGGVIATMNGNNPPLLAPGKAAPKSLAEATPDRYLYTPQTHPHLFFAALATGADFEPNPFPNGGLYSWYKDGRTPVTWLPHVSPEDVFYPPKDRTKNTPTLVRL